jgi:hypothetical protein
VVRVTRCVCEKFTQNEALIILVTPISLAPAVSMYITFSAMIYSFLYQRFVFIQKKQLQIFRYNLAKFPLTKYHQAAPTA